MSLIQGGLPPPEQSRIPQQAPRPAPPIPVQAASAASLEAPAEPDPCASCRGFVNPRARERCCDRATSGARYSSSIWYGAPSTPQARKPQHSLAAHCEAHAPPHGLNIGSLNSAVLPVNACRLSVAAHGRAVRTSATLPLRPIPTADSPPRAPAETLSMGAGFLVLFVILTCVCRARSARRRRLRQEADDANIRVHPPQPAAFSHG